jgi:hypothetical protein
MLLRPTDFCSSPYTKVSSNGHDKQNDLENVQAVRRGQCVGWRCSRHQEEPDERQNDASKGCRDAVKK